MNRILITIGLCLSVAALGCDNEPDNPLDPLGTGGMGGSAGMGGSGGMGGEGGMGGMTTPTDACTNVDDLALVCDPGWGDDVATCATDASGQGAATAACLVEDTGVSADCASCYGDTTQCVFDNCLTDCLPPNQNSEECLQCRAANCDTAFNSCTGDLMAGCE